MNRDEWAAPQEEITVTVDGHDLAVAYRDDGPEDDADEPPVVFLHGIPTWSYLWRDVAPAVAENYRVITPDLLGYGNSAMRDGFDRSIRAQEVMLGELLSNLDVHTVSLVAHDIGGGVALRYAAHNPESVDKLVCSNAVCYDSWPVEFISGLGLPKTTEMEFHDLETRVGSVFSQGTYGDADPEFVEGMVAPWLTEAGRTSLARCAVATNTNHTTEIDYGAISADVLCLWGADDVLQSIEYAERLADDTGGEVLALENAYHWVMEDRTQEYIEELRTFLDG